MSDAVVTLRARKPGIAGPVAAAQIRGALQKAGFTLDDEPKVMLTSPELEQAGLPTNVNRALTEKGIETLAALAAQTLAELLVMSGVKGGGLRDIVLCLVKNGLKLEGAEVVPLEALVEQLTLLPLGSPRRSTLLLPLSDYQRLKEMGWNDIGAITSLDLVELEAHLGNRADILVRALKCRGFSIAPLRSDRAVEQLRLSDELMVDFTAAGLKQRPVSSLTKAEIRTALSGLPGINAAASYRADVLRRICEKYGYTLT